MKLIKLTKNQFAKVSDADFDYLNRWKWLARWNPITNSFYVFRVEHPLQASGKRKQEVTFMHRVITNAPKGLDVDHIDHDTLNNQRENLRSVTHQVNLRNRKGAQSNNVLGILGVQPHGRGFRAHIKISGKHTCLKTRKTIEEAIIDRKEAVRLNYGNINAQ